MPSPAVTIVQLYWCLWFGVIDGDIVFGTFENLKVCTTGSVRVISVTYQRLVLPKQKADAFRL